MDDFRGASVRQMRLGKQYFAMNARAEAGNQAPTRVMRLKETTLLP
jgi:hypothetical protein